MGHTPLLEPGNGRICDSYLGGNGDSSLSSEGQLPIGDDDDRRLGKRYDIVPMFEGGDPTTCSFADPAETTIRGAICVVGDCIISSFRADGTDDYGVDLIRKVKQGRRSHDFVMKHGVELSSLGSHDPKTMSPA